MTTETVTLDKAVYERLIAKIKIAEMTFRRIAEAFDNLETKVDNILNELRPHSLESLVDRLSEEDVITLVGKLADKFPACADLFRSKCPECNWVPTPEEPVKEYYITVEGLYEGQSKVKVLAAIRRVFNLSYEETLKIEFPYKFVNENLKTYEPRAVSDFNILTNSGVWCTLGYSEVVQ